MTNRGTTGEDRLKLHQGATEAGPTGTAISVVVVSEVRLYREGIDLLLERDPEIHVLGAAASHRDARPLLERRPDVVLLDTTLASAAALTELGAPAQSVVVLGIAEQEEDVIAWAEAGAAGYVSRDGSHDDLRSTIVAAAHGETLASPRMVAALLRRLNAVAQNGAAPGRDGAAALTPRERQVARLMTNGLSNKEIARQLCIEVTTVKNHVHNILRKLEVSRRGQAAAFLRTPP